VSRGEKGGTVVAFSIQEGSDPTAGTPVPTGVPVTERELQRCSPRRYQPLQISTREPWHAENPSLSAAKRLGALANRSDPWIITLARFR